MSIYEFVVAITGGIGIGVAVAMLLALALVTVMRWR